MNPRASFLIPTLCEVERLEGLVRALRASARRSGVVIEIVIIDACSVDGTAEEARRLGVEQVLETSPGRAGQLNLGARHARGELLIMLHADASFSSAILDEMLAALQAGHVGGWCTVRLESESLDSGRGRRLGLALISWGINLRTRWFVTATGDQGIFVLRSTFDAIGGVPEVPLMEGNALARAMREHGSVAIVQTPLRISGRRWERRGLLRTTARMYAVRAAAMSGVPLELLARFWENEPGARSHHEEQS